jgi:hypothetical protein
MTYKLHQELEKDPNTNALKSLITVTDKVKPVNVKLLSEPVTYQSFRITEIHCIANVGKPNLQVPIPWDSQFHTVIAYLYNDDLILCDQESDNSSDASIPVG